MAINSSNLQETILKAIDAVVTQRNNELKLDKTITGIVKKNTGIKKGGKPVYEIEYAGGLINAMTQYADDIYTPKTSVYILIPQGDFSKDKIIIGRASTIRTDRSSSVVAAAVNKYSIIGSNLLESTSNTKISNLEFGLRSFHEKQVEETDDNPDAINHRAYFIYQKDVDGPIKFADNRLDIYKKESSAIMIKADFKTNLDINQRNQAGARYGLIFNFAFDNLNKGWGETNGEILEKVSQVVSGTIQEVENETTITKNVTLKEYVVDSFYNKLVDPNTTTENILEWIITNGLLDEELERTQAIYQSFQIDQKELDIDIVKNTVQAYLGLLQELKGYSTIASMRQRYNEWSATIIGDSSEKFEQFILTSDDMIGNPFTFNTWNTQYAVFKIDLETFNHLDSILFYHEGFIQDIFSERNWPVPKRYNPDIDQGGPDIFVKNLQIYAMNPLDNQSGDYTLKIEPSPGMDMIISSDENDTTQFRVTLLRKMYEDLTANAKVSYYWFKESSFVINADSTGYHYLGGPGWRKMDHNETNYLFTSSVNDNLAYKNNYKCVAVYEPAEDDKTILSCPFTIYNKDNALDIKLESDRGTKFSYDGGTPIITVLINKNRLNENSIYEEIGFDPNTSNPEFLYSWAIEDASNEYILFLNEITSEANTVKDAILLDSKQDLLKRIKKYVTYKKNNDDFSYTRETSIAERATRIEYPISIGSSGFTITCYVRKYNSNRNVYVDVGSASLEFMNQDTAIVSDYRIQIVNGDQVFQYDEYGKTPCSEAFKDPLVIKPLQAKLFTPSGVEVTETNYTVEWTIPIEDTMLLTDVELQKDPNTGLNQNYIGKELAFSIADLYNPNAYNNQFTCHIKFNEKDYYKDTNFYVGKVGNNGTNGTDVVAKINYKGNDLGRTLHYQPLTLYVQKFKTGDAENITITGQGMWNIGPNILKETLSIVSPQENAGVLDLSVYQKNSLLGKSNYNLGYPKWNIAGNANGRTNEVAKFFSLGEGNGDEINWSYSNLDETRYRIQNIRAEISIKDEKEDQEDPTYYAFYSLPIIEYEPKEEGELPVNSLLPSNRIAINKNSYLNEIVYNADGRNPIYNHNQGLELINLPENAVVFWTARGGLDAIKGGFSNSIKQVIESKPSFSLIPEKDSKDGSVIYTTSETNLTNKAKIYVLPNDTFDGAATNNRIEAKIYIPEIEDPAIAEEKALKQQYIELIEKEYENLISLYKEYSEKALTVYNNVENPVEANNQLTNLEEELSQKLRDTVNNFVIQFKNKKIVKDLFTTALSHVGDNLQAEKNILLMQSWFSEDFDFSAFDKFKENIKEMQNNLEKIIYNELHKEEVIAEHYDDIVQNSIRQQNNIIDSYREYMSRRENILRDSEIGIITAAECSEKLQELQDIYSTVLQQQISQIAEEKQEYSAILNSIIDNYQEMKDQAENILEKNKNNQNQLILAAVKSLYDIQDNFQRSLEVISEKLFSGSDDDDDSVNVIIKNIFTKIQALKIGLNNQIESQESIQVVDDEGNWINTDHTEEVEGFKIEEYLSSIEDFFIDISNEVKTEDSLKGYKLYATVYAPIHMSLNTFGLASVNAWDGNSITIDEDRGAVLAPQIAAGEKDSNNRFTGIVMGKTKNYTGDANGEKQTGLFGFAYGLQSIFLDAETGNATFGLPDGDALTKDSSGHYNGLIQDTYGEGRIELRPGDVSKIGGWRIGRRSLYYTTKPTSTNINNYQYQYDGEIGSPYSQDIGTPLNKQYAAHHEKDIKTEDGGLLLSANPPYISIKGEKLTSAEIDNGLNSQLMAGDSLEIQLDPKTPTLFTIFRHNSPNRDSSVRNKRQFLAGINDKGELLANGVGKEDGEGTGTKSGNIILKAFKDTINQETGSYVGAVFEAGSGLASTRTFFQIFVNKNKALDTTAQVYITGGQSTSSGQMQSTITKDEYQRPISIHGSSLMLYAKDSDPVNYDSPTTNANIQISTNIGQINLGNNTQLYLHRNANNVTNILKTNGPFNWEVGTSKTRKDLTINAANLTENYSSIDQTVADNTQIKNSGNYIVDLLNNIKHIYLRIRNDTNDSNESYFALDKDRARLGVPKKNNIKSFIDLNYEEKNSEGKFERYVSSWSLLNNDLDIILNTNGGGEDEPHNYADPKCLMIQSAGVGNGSTHSPSLNSQLTLCAGNTKNIKYGTNTQNATYTKLSLNTSNNNWVLSGNDNVSDFTSSNIKDYSLIGGHWKTDGIPFEVAVQSSTKGGETVHAGSISIRTNTINPSTSTPTRFYNFFVNMGQRIAGGLVVMGGITTEHKDTLSNVGIWSVKDIGTESKIWGTHSNMICDGSSQGVSGGGTKDLGNSFTIYAPKITLQNNGRPKIESDSITFTYNMPDAADVHAIPTSVYDGYNSLKAWIESLMPDLSSYAKKSDLPDMDNYVTKNTFDTHHHKIQYATVDVQTTSGATRAVLTRAGNPAGFTDTP